MNQPIEPIQNLSERYPKTEKIDGKIYLMSAPCSEHIDVQANLTIIFGDYFKKKKRKCRIRQDDKTNIDDKTYFKPDLKVVCFEKNDGGMPVIVIEVLSKSTRDRDLSVKMEKYARLGAKEYWIITWEMSSIDIYLLNDNQTYEFYKSYVIISDEELNEDDELSEEEKKQFVKEFSPVSFPELVIKLEDVFDIYF